jgi:hypothetical protein
MRSLFSTHPAKPSPIERAAFAKVKTFGNGRDPATVFPDDPIVKAILTRADQTIGTTGTSGWASQVAPNVVGDFLAGLAPISAAARVIAQGMMVRVPAAANDDGVPVSLTLPSRSGQPPATSTPWVAEGAPITVRKYTLNGDTVLTPKKFAFIVAFSRELAKQADGEMVVRQMMREDAAVALDVAYFSTTAASTAAHAGLLNGLTATVGFGGGDRVAFDYDLTALITAVGPGGSGQVVFVVSPATALRVAVRFPDVADKFTFLPSLAVADGTVVAIDPLSLVHGFGDDVDLDVSIEALFHLEDSTPLEIVSAAGTVADPTRSLYQTAVIALRLIADVGFAKRRSGAVAYLTGATW